MTSKTKQRPVRSVRPSRRSAPGSVYRTNKPADLDKEGPEQRWFIFMLVLFLAAGISAIGFISYIVLLG